MSNLPQQQQVPRRYIVSPSIDAPRRLAFYIRKRGLRIHTGGVSRLLILNRFGVWSVVHDRYIRRTSYHRFCAFVHHAEEVDQHALYERLAEAEADWVEGYDAAAREEVRLLRPRIARIYWAVQPAARKANMALERYRMKQERRRAALERHRRMQERRRVDAAERLRRKRLAKRALIFALPAMLGLTLIRDMLVSEEAYGVWWNLCVCLAYAAWVYCFHFICMYDE